MYSKQVRKSWMIMQLASAVLEGKEFLGLRCNACGAMYSASKRLCYEYQRQCNTLYFHRKLYIRSRQKA